MILHSVLCRLGRNPDTGPSFPGFLARGDQKFPGKLCSGTVAKQNLPSVAVPFPSVIQDEDAGIFQMGVIQRARIRRQRHCLGIIAEKGDGGGAFNLPEHVADGLGNANLGLAIMVDEAEGVLKRLETEDKKVREEAAYEKQNIDTIVKKVKVDRKKRDSSEAMTEDESAGTIGL